MFSHPLDLPLGLTVGSIPLVWVLGHISGNVSWVDRSWPFWPVICSAMVVWWGYQESTGRFDDSLPRLSCMLGLQLVWSARLTSNAIRRDFYDLTSEDYRYLQFRKLVPKWFFEIVHIIVIAIAQPVLLFSLCLPLYSLLITPASPSGSKINVYDIILVLSGLTLVGIEYISDNAMFAYQTAKHGSKSTDIIKPPPSTSNIGPKPASYPRGSHPGFITSSLFRYVRHPNFAAEQLFWLNQALFAVNAGLASGVPREKWLSFGLIFAPPFALSLLFCSSTFFTEWITSKKYPTYRRYKRLAGQFLPQETMWVLLWGGIRGTTTQDAAEVFVAPR